MGNSGSATDGSMWGWAGASQAGGDGQRYLLATVRIVCQNPITLLHSWGRRSRWLVVAIRRGGFGLLGTTELEVVD